MKLQIVLYYVKTKEKQKLVKNKAGKQEGSSHESPFELALWPVQVKAWSTGIRVLAWSSS